MKLLILGGTRFSGLHFVRMAVAAGHHVTVLHRGRHAAALPPGVDQITGDRDPRLGDGLEQLARRISGGARWDAAVDMCGFVPRVVAGSADTLGGAVGRVLFVSSISVYPSSATGSPVEDDPVIELDDPSVEQITGETYGGLKVLCERIVHERFGDRATVIRPGLIVGPGDETDRFTYWVRRFVRGGRVLVPAESECPTRWIDARDLAAFFLQVIERDITGVFNVAGPREPIGFGAFIFGVKHALGSSVPADLTLEPRSPSWRAGRGIRDWLDLPVFTGEHGSSMGRVRSDRAFAAGLSTRSLASTVVDTLEWDRRRGEPALTAGLTADRERSVLEAS